MRYSFTLLSTAIVLLTMQCSISPASAKSRKAAAPEQAVEPAPKPRIPDDPGCKSCVQQAAPLFANGKMKEACSLLEQWSEKCPNNAQLHLLYSTIMLRTGDLAKAQEQAKLATEASPSSMSAHLQHAITLVSLDKPTHAAREFERVVELDPSSYEAWTALGSLYRQLHEDDKAAEAAAKAANLDPSTRAKRLNTLVNLKRAGKYAEARAEIKRLLTDKTISPEFAEELARESLMVGAFDEAVQAAGKAKTAHPNSVAPLMTSAIAYFCQNNFEGCIIDSNRIVELDPRNTDGFSLKALALVKANRLGEAEASMQNASPDAGSALYWLSKGLVALSKDDAGEAEKSLLSCLEYDQGNVALQGIPHSLARISLAELYKKQGKTQLVTEQIQALSRDKRFAATSPR